MGLARPTDLVFQSFLPGARDHVFYPLDAWRGSCKFAGGKTEGKLGIISRRHILEQVQQDLDPAVCDHLPWVSRPLRRAFSSNCLMVAIMNLHNHGTYPLDADDGNEFQGSR